MTFVHPDVGGTTFGDLVPSETGNPGSLDLKFSVTFGRFGYLISDESLVKTETA